MSSKIIIVVILVVMSCLVGVSTAKINACGFPDDLPGFPACYRTFHDINATPSPTPTIVGMQKLSQDDDIGKENRVLIDDQVISNINYKSPIIVNISTGIPKSTQVRFEKTGKNSVTKTIQVFSESIIFDTSDDDISFVQSLTANSDIKTKFAQTKSDIKTAKTNVLSKSLSLPVGKQIISPTLKVTINPTVVPTVSQISTSMYRDECGFIIGDPYAKSCNFESNIANAQLEPIVTDEAYYGYQKSRTEPWEAYWRVVDTIDGKVIIYSDFATKQMSTKSISEGDYKAYISDVVANKALPDKELVRRLAV